MKNIRVKNLSVLILLIAAVAGAQMVTNPRSVTSKTQDGSSGVEKVDISFSNDGLKLAGTLFVTAGKRPKPALVIAHGSGKEGRHLRGYQYMGRMFAEFGFATFIFDKRGVGESEGEYVEAGDLLVPAGDLVAAVNAIKKHPKIDRKRIGILGISQGGWTGPLAATMSKDISFVVSLVGGGISVREQVLHIRKSQLIAAGWPDEKIEPAIEFARRLFTYVGSGVGYAEFKDDYAKAAESAEWFSFIRAMRFGETLVKPNKLNHPFFKSLAYDPSETEGKLRIPYLVILGEKDTNMPTQETVAALKNTFCKSGSKKYKLVTLPNEGHNIFKMENGTPSYRDSFKQPLLEWLAQFKN